MRVSVRTGELDRVVSRTNSFNEISESQDLESSVSFTRDAREAPSSNNNTNPSSGNMSPKKDEASVATAVVEPVTTDTTETKPVEVVEAKQEDKRATVADVAVESHIREQQALESPKANTNEKTEEAVEPKKEGEPEKITLTVKNVSPAKERASDKR